MVKIVSPWLTLVASFLETPQIHLHCLFVLRVDRETAVGQMISRYLEQKCEIEDHSIHLLFTANRWEAV